MVLHLQGHILELGINVMKAIQYCMPRVILKLLIACLSSASLCPSAHALDPKLLVTQYSRRVWGVENGLPDRTVRKIVQTPEGYLWVATRRGLARFDGVRFTLFNKDNSAGLKSNWIMNLLVSNDGVLWIGTYGGGLSVYRNERFTSYTIDDGLPSNSITALARSGDGGLWVGTNEGLSHFQGGKLTTFDDRDGLIDRYVLSLLVDRNGTAWIGTQKGVQLYRNGQFLDSPPLDALRAHAVISLSEDPSGKIWIGTEGGGLAAFWQDQIKVYSKGDGLSSNSVPATLSDSSGNLWIATTGGGLARYKDGAFDAYTIKNGFPGQSTTALFEDREGNLWVGITSVGLMQLKDSRFIPLGTGEGLSGNQISSILEARDGSIWIGTNLAGLNQLRDGKIQTIGGKDTFEGYNISSLAETRDGSIWVGTSGGLYQIKDGRIRHYTTKNGLSFNSISSIYEDAQELLWIGTVDGLNLIDKGKIASYRQGDGRGIDQIASIAQGPDGSLWIGTLSAGIARFQNGKFTQYAVPDGRLVSGASALYADKEGTLWIADGDSGLIRIKDGRFAIFENKDGLGSNPIRKILEDDYGQFWLTTSYGILRTSRKNLEDFADGTAKSINTVLFNEADGMRNSGCSGGFSSAIKTRDGRLWFATIEGIVVAEPRAAGVRRTIPPAIVEEFAADVHSAKSGTGVVAEPGQGSLEIRYTSLSFANPESLRFKYRLDGFDRSWANVGNRRIAYYTNVPPGRYRFQVAAGTDDGKWNDTITSMDIYLRPHFYQTYWFYGLCSLAILSVVFMLHNLRVRNLRATERNLSKRVEQALADVKILQGFLPICASCKNIRDDQGYWNHIEAYISEHSEAEFSHGICPKCAAKLYPEYADLFDEGQLPKSPPGNDSPA
jgi:ligand-binding sensor domain-containing protein